MALSVYRSHFDSRSSAGSQAITGVGFEPTLVIFMASNKTGTGDGAGFISGLGAATTSSNEGAMGWADQDGVGTSVARRCVSGSACIFTCGYGAGTVHKKADLTSMDADGFTLNFSTSTSTSRIHYIALAGADLTNADVSIYTCPATTGTQAYTGVGFQPDGLLIFGNDENTLDASQSTGFISVGMASSPTERGCSSGYHQHNQGTSNTFRHQVTNAVLNTLNASGTTNNTADLDSFDADGFTLDFSVVNSGKYFVAISMKGPEFKVGTETQKTSTGTKATTGIGFTPVAMFASSVADTAGAAVSADARFSFGMTAGTTESYMGDTSTDNVTTTEVAFRSQTNDFIGMLSGGTPTVDAEASVSSLDADGFTLNWGTADATAREFLYMAIGDTVIASGGGKSNPLSGPLGGPLSGVLG